MRKSIVNHSIGKNIQPYIGKLEYETIHTLFWCFCSHDNEVKLSFYASSSFTNEWVESIGPGDSLWDWFKNYNTAAIFPLIFHKKDMNGTKNLRMYPQDQKASFSFLPWVSCTSNKEKFLLYWG